MPESALALPVGEVVDDVVLARRRAQSLDIGRRQAIEAEGMTRPPRDVVVRARGFPAHADGADLLAAGVIQPEPASEHVDAAHELADERILRCPVLARIARSARLP